MRYDGWDVRVQVRSVVTARIALLVKVEVGGSKPGFWAYVLCGRKMLSTSISSEESPS